MVGVPKLRILSPNLTGLSISQTGGEMKNWKEGDRFKNPDKSIGENKGKILTLSLNGWAVIQYDDGQCSETPSASLEKMEKDE